MPALKDWFACFEPANEKAFRSEYAKLCAYAEPQLESNPVASLLQLEALLCAAYQIARHNDEDPSVFLGYALAWNLRLDGYRFMATKGDQASTTEPLLQELENAAPQTIVAAVRGGRLTFSIAIAFDVHSPRIDTNYSPDALLSRLESHERPEDQGWGDRRRVVRELSAILARPRYKAMRTEVADRLMEKGYMKCRAELAWQLRQDVVVNELFVKALAVATAFPPYAGLRKDIVRRLQEEGHIQSEMELVLAQPLSAARREGVVQRLQEEGLIQSDTELALARSPRAIGSELADDIERKGREAAEKGNDVFSCGLDDQVPLGPLETKMIESGEATIEELAGKKRLVCKPHKLEPARAA
jgi:hypothetical protein